MIYTLLYNDAQGAKNTISFDCILSASETYTSSLTEHPVESGMPIADNITHKNTTISIEGMVSDYNVTNPSKGIEFVKFIDGEIFSDVKIPPPAIPILREQLLFVRNNKVPITLSVGKSGDDILTEYTNCIMTSLTFNDTGANGVALYASLTLVPIRIASVKTQQEKAVPDVLLKAVEPSTAKDGDPAAASNDPNKPQIGSDKKADPVGLVDEDILKRADENRRLAEEYHRKADELSKGAK